MDTWKNVVFACVAVISVATCTGYANVYNGVFKGSCGPSTQYQK